MVKSFIGNPSSEPENRVWDCGVPKTGWVTPGLHGRGISILNDIVPGSVPEEGKENSAPATRRSSSILPELAKQMPPI
jgi:hypothetical protein